MLIFGEDFTCPKQNAERGIHLIHASSRYRFDIMQNTYYNKKKVCVYLTNKSFLHFTVVSLQCTINSRRVCSERYTMALCLRRLAWSPKDFLFQESSVYRAPAVVPIATAVRTRGPELTGYVRIVFGQL